MTKQRYIQYGYCLKDGEIQINQEELKIVKMIFGLYIAGNSYLSISKILNEKNIKYSDTSIWNKNNVGRIIKNARYVDGTAYPPIITEDIFNKAQNISSNNYSKKHQRVDEQKIELKKMLYCDNCKSRLNSKYGKWICTKCDSPANISHMDMEEKLQLIYSNLIGDISLIEIPKFTPYVPDIDVKRMENELNRYMDITDIDKQGSLNAILQLADARYKVCDDGSNGRNGEKIKQHLSNCNSSEKLNIVLIKNITDKIIVQSDGDFYILLKNGQEIR